MVKTKFTRNGREVMISGAMRNFDYGSDEAVPGLTFVFDVYISVLRPHQHCSGIPRIPIVFTDESSQPELIMRYSKKERWESSFLRKKLKRIELSFWEFKILGIRVYRHLKRKRRRFILIHLTRISYFKKNYVRQSIERSTSSVAQPLPLITSARVRFYGSTNF